MNLNWRELVLRHAAKILDEFGEHEIAQKLYDYRLPMLDGGGAYCLKRDGDRNWKLVAGNRQSVPRPSAANDEMWLVPLPPELWDPPKEKCCDRPCCRSKVG